MIALTENASLDSLVPVSMPSATEISFTPLSCRTRTRRRMSIASETVARDNALAHEPN
jgi:hypothetical protein